MEKLLKVSEQHYDAKSQKTTTNWKIHFYKKIIRWSGDMGVRWHISGVSLTGTVDTKKCVLVDKIWWITSNFPSHHATCLFGHYKKYYCVKMKMKKKWWSKLICAAHSQRFETICNLKWQWKFIRMLMNSVGMANASILNWKSMKWIEMTTININSLNKDWKKSP